MQQNPRTSFLSLIFLGIGAIMLPVVAVSLAVSAILPARALNGIWLQAGVGLASTLLAFLSYVLLFRWQEKRRISELSLRPMLPQLALGLLIGALLISATVAVVAMVGQVRIIAINPGVAMGVPFFMALQSAIVEELLFRGVLLRLLNARFGSLPALAVSALVFGTVHMMNPGATWLSALAVAIEAGGLLGLAFLASRCLWLPIGIHFAWNFVQSGVFSLTTSGLALPEGLLATQISGPLWATGGAFGLEQSVQAVAFCLVASAGLYGFAKAKSRILRAQWRA